MTTTIPCNLIREVRHGVWPSALRLHYLQYNFLVSNADVHFCTFIIIMLTQTESSMHEKQLPEGREGEPEEGCGNLLGILEQKIFLSTYLSCCFWLDFLFLLVEELLAPHLLSDFAILHVTQRQLPVMQDSELFSVSEVCPCAAWPKELAWPLAGR